MPVASEYCVEIGMLIGRTLMPSGVTLPFSLPAQYSIMLRMGIPDANQAALLR